MKIDAEKSKPSKKIHSAIYRGLCQLCEELTIQSALVAQITKENCEQWQRDVINESISLATLPQSDSTAIQHRLLMNADAACSQLYLSFIQFFILRLSSVLELYLKDSLKQSMKLNHKLFAKGFEKNEYGGWVVKCIPSKLQDEYSPSTYLTYINAIAAYYTKGEKWSKKFSQYVKFLDLGTDSIGNAVVASKLDNLFEIRNDIAHLNRHSDAPPSLTTTNGLSFNRETALDNVSYREVIAYLIGIMDETISLLERTDILTNKKYPTLSTSPADAYLSIVEKYRRA
jgi:hypothetical protein